MLPNKIKVSASATEKLKHLKARTGLTPNILCRLGFCLSLAEETALEPNHFQQDGKEFNRYTLLGELDLHLTAMFRQWRTLPRGTDDKEEQDSFLAHINRGILLLNARVKNVSDLAQLVLVANNAQASSAKS